MELYKLFVSQRKLRAPEQVPALVVCVLDHEPLPPILVSEDDDGTLQIEDGHHRATAYWLSGRIVLQPHEYLLLPRTRRRPRFGRIADLIARVRAGSDVLDELLAALETGRVRGPPATSPRPRPRSRIRHSPGRAPSSTIRSITRPRRNAASHDHFIWCC